MYQLTEIWVYPIKSLGGISMPTARVEMRGLQHDRRWMLVDENGQFLTQREFAEMALLKTGFDSGHLTVYHSGTPSEVLRIPLDLPASEYTKTRVKVWSDAVSGQALPPEINQWFSEVLKHPVRLVRMPDTTRRHTDGRYAPKGQLVSFADGFPFLLVGQTSLDDLNSRLEQPLPMNRFRPNFVFTGGTPFEEDQWRDFTIGDVQFRGVKPCARCAIITTDQQTGFRGVEPTKTLATFRKNGNKILFGQNVIWLGTGDSSVNLGDELIPAKPLQA